MKLGRYQEVPSSLGFLQSSQKINARRTASSFSKNPEETQTYTKLPALSNSMVMRSSSVSMGSERNTKNRLNYISDKLNDLQSDLHNTRMEANETLNHMRFLKTQLVDKKLAQDHQDLRGQVEGLRKLVRITKYSHEKRSSDLRDDYINLWNQTQELRELLFSLQMRVDKIDSTMGMNHP